jgi:hypothetical protein
VPHDGRRAVLDRQEGADQVDAQDLLPQLDALLKQGHEAAADAGVSKYDVEAAELLFGPRDERLHVDLVA